MPHSKTHISPLAKHNQTKAAHSKASKSSKLVNRFSWVIILVFSISTFTALGLIFAEIRGNVGLAAQNLAGYNTWKTQFGLNAGDVDANWNRSGDGISNYNKYLLGLNPNQVVDGSIIAITTATSVTNTNTDTARSPIQIPASTNPISNTLQATGPALGTNSNTTTTTTGSTGTSTGGPSGTSALRPNITASTSPTSIEPTNNVPILGNPIPNSAGQLVGSSGTNRANTATTPNSGATGSTATGTTATSTTASSASGSAATANLSAGGATSTAATNTGGTLNTSGATTGGIAGQNTVNSSGVTTGAMIVGTRTVTDRTGGDFNFIIFMAGLASLASGAYILKSKFTKNSLAVHQGQK